MKFPQWQGFSKPNTTDIPNELLLVVLPQITKLSVAKVLFYVAWKTLKWGKWEDWIALEQFEHGVHNDPMDNGCGLSHPAILEGIEDALQFGFIRRRFVCPSCDKEVRQSDAEERPWQNRHGSGQTTLRTVPDNCPHCNRQLRGFERPMYRLAFRDEIVQTSHDPHEFFAKYRAKKNGKDQQGEVGISTGEVEISSRGR